MSQSLSNKVALVTGASRGIGRAIAVALAKQGATVAVHYGGSTEAANQTVSEVEAAGGKAFLIQEDLSQPGAAKHLFAKLDSELTTRTGTNKFDILVNNAGVAPFTPLSETSEEEFDNIFAINVRSPYFLAQEAATRLNDNARIINLSSVVSRIPGTAAPAYSMSKGAVDTLTEVLAGELGARGITVNAVAPGVIQTEMAEPLIEMAGEEGVHAMQSIKRIGQPGDVADLVAYLASEQSRWVTGQVIEVSGGTKIVL